MKINFMTGDITKVAGRFDVIVNAANNTLLGGGGVDGAIHKAAGPGLLEECKTLGECETGSAKITKAYNIPCKGIIHTVGPKYTEDPVNAPILLFLAYINSIDVAVTNGYKKIAFPSISTGIYKYPVEEAAQIAKRAAYFMGEKHPDLELTWVLFTEEDYSTYTRIFFHNSRLSEGGKIMWKRRETVTETERCKIVEIADKYEVPMRDVTSEFQSEMSFDDINYHLKKE